VVKRQICVLKVFVLKLGLQSRHVFCGFLESFQANTGIAPSNKKLQIPSLLNSDDHAHLSFVTTVRPKVTRNF
jgi:hypothetical protein